jgi:hypothetical protein
VLFRSGSRTDSSRMASEVTSLRLVGNLGHAIEQGTNRDIIILDSFVIRIA